MLKAFNDAYSCSPENGRLIRPASVALIQHCQIWFVVCFTSFLNKVESITIAASKETRCLKAKKLVNSGTGTETVLPVGLGHCPYS